MTQRSTPSDGSAWADDLRVPQSVMRIPLWVSLVVILGALLTATGVVISKVDPTATNERQPHDRCGAGLCRLAVCAEPPVGGKCCIFS